MISRISSILISLSIFTSKHIVQFSLNRIQVDNKTISNTSTLLSIFKSPEILQLFSWINGFEPISDIEFSESKNVSGLPELIHGEFSES